ncbi:hypothetical protein [Mesoflavibacter zeaxanthinifaciens]|uniref:hypothetical protein n=1 Tax=Mesoflavibacter zeaxanthinifaciens TaxID=393060 RepID=UPI003A949037
MQNINYNTLIHQIKYLNESFVKFQQKGRSAIDELNERCKEANLNPELSEIGELTFKIFNKKFIVRIEIKLNENGKFDNGEIVTYCCLNDEEELLVLTSHFDDIGNYANDFLVEEFSENYLIMFFNKMADLSKDNKIKFPLLNFK